MKWFRPTLAVLCAGVATLAFAWPSWSYPAPEPPVAPEQIVKSCSSEPGWFQQIHLYYNCDPKITPDFDFASLYAG